MLIDKYGVSFSCATNFHTKKVKKKLQIQNQNTNKQFIYFQKKKIEENRVNVISAFDAIGIRIENALVLMQTIEETLYKRALMPLSNANANEMLQSFTVQNDIKALELAT